MKATFETLSSCFYTLHSRHAAGHGCAQCREEAVAAPPPCVRSWVSSAELLQCSTHQSVSQIVCERRECSRNGRCLNHTLSLQPRKHYHHCMTSGWFYGLSPLLQPSACLRFYKMQQIRGLHVNQVFYKLIGVVYANTMQQVTQVCKHMTSEFLFMWARLFSLVIGIF